MDAAEGGVLLGPAEIRDLADQLHLAPTKKLGQNFVVDGNTVRKIVRIADVSAGDQVLEVGPGLGSLTLGLTETGARVVAVEIDARLAEQLPKTVAMLQPDAELTVVTGDGMTIAGLPGQPTVLVANLPYNVSVPILIHLLTTLPSLERGLVMVQAEVGHRLAARPGSKVYGVPSVKVAWFGDWQVVGQISRQVFWPVPNVDSVLVGYSRRSAPLGSEDERAKTFEIVDAAFGQRRKMLRQSLQPLLGSDAQGLIIDAGCDPTLRAEQLSVDDFLAIARVVLARS